jgi:hypothetical protein
MEQVEIRLRHRGRAGEFLTEVRHDHSLAVVARKASVEYTFFTEPRAPASDSVTNFG